MTAFPLSAVAVDGDVGVLVREASDLRGAGDGAPRVLVGSAFSHDQSIQSFDHFPKWPRDLQDFSRFLSGFHLCAPLRRKRRRIL